MFFALWPDEQVRFSIEETLSRMPSTSGGRVVPKHNLHITLHFIGSVTDERKDCLHAAAQSVKLPSFEFQLNHFGVFSKAKIFWMGCQHVPEELLQLNQSLGEALGQCGYQQEKRLYTPHVSLIRKYRMRLDDQPVFSIPWSVNEFVLVESIIDNHGANYQVIEKYPLS